MNSISTDFNLSEDQLRAFDDYTYFYQFRKTLQNNGRDIATLDSLQIETLSNFVQGDGNFAKGLAQNVLCFYYGICRDDDFSTSSGNRVMYMPGAPAALNLNQMAKIKEAKITVAPNPAIDIAIFNYYLPSTTGKAMLVISDITGKEIERFKLKDTEGQINWYTSTINSGLYYYSVKVGNSNLVNGKISVKK